MHEHMNQFLRVAVSTLLTVTFTAGMFPTAAAALEDGETPWRYVGIRSGAAEECPAPHKSSGWQTEQLFDQTTNPELGRFCLYRRFGQGDPAVLYGLDLERLDADVMGVGAQASELADISWLALQDHFLQQAGQVSLPAALPVRVRLAVLDASPDSTASGADGPEDIEANSPHGTALLNMARDLVCDATETECRATVASRLAMSWECFDATSPQDCRDVLAGGYVGLISELARAINAEVMEWRNGAAEDRLIINLSLGWHQEFGGGEAQVHNMPVYAQAVFRALEDAVCRGALPIVAAGNRDASSVPQSGPFLPALWETRPAPSVATCQSLNIVTAGTSAAYRPMVFSVAGVKASGAALDTTRRNGVSRLAAFGDHGVVDFSNSGLPTGTLTGSSVAALVVSATAAALWSFFPEADAFALMEAIYRGAEPLGRQADYWQTTPRPASTEVRKVALCDTLSTVCSVSEECVELECSPEAALDLSNVDFRKFEDPAVAIHVDVSTIDDALGLTPQCGSETVLYDSHNAPPVDPCPHRQFEGASHRLWAEPQPESIPCPNCMGYYQSPGKLFVEIDDTWRGELSSATLRCGDTSYALGLPTLAPGDKVWLYNVPETCLTAFPTFFSFTHRGSRATLSPVRLCLGCL